MGKTIERTPVWWTVARGVLLAAVLTGLFAMHVLTADHDTLGHGMLPTVSISDMAAHDGPAENVSPDENVSPAGPEGLASPDRAMAGPMTMASPAPGVDHGALAGCILFLVIAGAALILALFLLRIGSGLTAQGRDAGAALIDIRRRGPPGRWPRLALCVIRV